jgi:hypothetical protein
VSSLGDAKSSLGDARMGMPSFSRPDTQTRARREAEAREAL